MIKLLLTPLWILSSLYSEEIEKAQEIDPEVMNSIHIEAALFVAVFTLMSIISIIVSKKHAKQNVLKDREKRKKQKAEKEAENQLKSDTIKETHEVKRVTELSKMLKDGLITDEEFQVLNDSAKAKSHTK